MTITASMVKELRDKTGAGMMDSKKALEETNGDMEKAITYLREQGVANVQKKADRITSEGLVESYIHGGRIGVLLEVNSETDFVAKNDEFKRFVKDIAMQIAAQNPQYISKDQVPEEEVEAERQVLKQQALNEGKPEHIVEQMVEGRLGKFFEQICLLEQPFIKDGDQTVSQLLTELISRIGENIVIRRFVRYELGEGLEKREEDFAAEVAAQIE